MKENDKNQAQEIHLPPVWCAGICRNAMNDICIENCAIHRDTSGFVIRPDLTLDTMPRFPQTAGLTREERFTVVTIYLAKIVDHLQGVQNESHIIRRPHSHRSSSSHLSPIVEIKDLLPDLQKGISASTGGKEREDQRVGSEALADSAD